MNNKTQQRFDRSVREAVAMTRTARERESLAGCIRRAEREAWKIHIRRAGDDRATNNRTVLT